MDELSGIKIYPNPTNGITTSTLIRAISDIEIKIINTMSKIVYSEISEKITGNNLTIDLSNQPKGIYFITLKSDKIEFTTKIVIQ